MTDPKPVTDTKPLLQRLEESQEGSRELDRLIAPIVGWYRITPAEAKRTGYASPKHGGWVAPEDCRDGKPVFCGLHGTDVYRDPPAFTTSVDAALSLVPSGWHGRIWVGDKPLHIPDARVTLWSNDTKVRESVFGPIGNAATLPLALCIASLRAIMGNTP